MIKNFIVREGEKESFCRILRNFTEEKGEGYISYIWPKPADNDINIDKEKISFVKLFKPGMDNGSVYILKILIHKLPHLKHNH